VLRFLDPEPFRRNAPLVIGYSDVTLLLTWLIRRAGLAAFHGPFAWSVEPGLDPETEGSLQRALASAEPWGAVGVGHARILVPGRASGPLVGGNLTMVAHTLGTPYEVDVEGALLFLEDTSGYEDSEEDIEQALFHLEMAGVLGRAAGFVVGELSDDEDYAESLLDTFLELVGEDRPVLAGFPAGHVRPNLSLPLGVRCEIDTDRHSGLEVVEAPLTASALAPKAAVR
jgi:muramoyltetrapeptide carboxypeptidase